MGLQNFTRDDVVGCIRSSAAAIAALEAQAVEVEALCTIVVNTLQRGGKVLTAGNGGSAAEALHMSEELVGRYKGNRVSLPGIALVADCTALTCIGNDFGFDDIFSRQVEGLGAEHDLLVLFSTSGRASNLVQAAQVARRKGMTSVALLGKSGGEVAHVVDQALIVPGEATERIQEVHQLIMHIILEAVEQAFCPDTETPA